MGQKIHPIGFRVGISRGWQSLWFAEKNYGAYIAEDIKIRHHVRALLSSAGISKVVIERSANKANVLIYAAKPGFIIGKQAKGLNALEDSLRKISSSDISTNVIEVRKQELDAYLVAENIAKQLEKRVSFRKAMKKALGLAKRNGAKGVKIMCAGRLGGAEMSRTERYLEGQVPLHTLRADIDYAIAEAKTTYGIIGVKVWIYKGELNPGEIAS